MAHLPVTSLEASIIRRGDTLESVFQFDNPVFKLMVRDCDEHRRALGIMAEEMRGQDPNSVNLGKLMDRVKNKLVTKYKDTIEFTPVELKAILRAILTHQITYGSDFPNTNVAPRSFRSPG